MDKKYLSGAQKRKLRAKKNEAEQELLKKVPKISTIFGGRESENTDKHDETNSDIATTADTEKHDEKESDQASYCDASSGMLSNTSHSFDHSIDPGLWDIQNNQSNLQTFWIKHGI